MKARSCAPCLLLALLSSISILPSAAAPAQHRGQVIYVATQAQGADDGTSWDDAFRSLQSALAVAAIGDEIWVAEGTYRPTDGDDRAATFALIDGVLVLGGFVGTETDSASRDPWAHPTILNGNIGAPDTEGDDSFHVVTAGAAVGPKTVLDGFVIERGNAVGAAPLGGGGMYVAGSPTISRCVLRDNRGDAGGAVYFDIGSPVFVNASFVGNVAGTGGAVYTRGGEVSLINVELVTNRAERGAAALVESGRLELTNATVARNVAEQARGALWIEGGEVLVHNSIVWGNSPSGPPLGGLEPLVAYSDIEGGFSGAGNLDADPSFVDTGRGDFRLAPGSPAIDAGANALVPPSVTTARGGGARIAAGRARRGGVEAVVDLGAWEFDGETSRKPDGGQGRTVALGILGDSDGDGVPDETDCRPLDPDVWAVPSPVQGLFAEGKSPTALSWSPPAAPGGTSMLYDVLRSTSASGFSSGVCIASDLASVFTTDEAPVGGAFYYLVRAKNACGGSLGTDSAENPRIGAACSGIGQPCSSDTACTSGFCTDGYCCASRCSETCESCAEPGLAGTCSAVPAGTDPADECPAYAESTCGLSGQCSGERSCALWPEGTVCTPASCRDARSVNLADACDGAGTCVDGGVDDCAPYMCDFVGSPACRTSCSASWECDLSTSCCSTLCVDTSTDPVNCGYCGGSCTNPHGTTSCAGGTCQPACDSLWASCDSNPMNGCETSLATLTDCGGCDVPCELPNANESCATGECVITSCQVSYSNCDSNNGNGCEVFHAADSNNCSSAEYVGSHPGDVNCGFICPSIGWFEFTSRNGRTQRWFRARATESSTCSAAIQHRIRLTSPPGSDYDLFVYSACGVVWASSQRGPGLIDEVTISVPDDGFVDDSYDYWVLVRYYAGASCSSWLLEFFGHGC